MQLAHFHSLFPGTRYSKKLAAKIAAPKNGGFFTQEQAEERHVRLSVGQGGNIEAGNQVAFYLLVDETDGVIVDAKFQAFGEPSLIGAADMACEILLRKTFLQAQHISAELLDKQLRDKSTIRAFPKEDSSVLNLVLSAINNACEKCHGISLPETPPPQPLSGLSCDDEEGSAEGRWETLSLLEKLALIERVIASDIQPYIELDAGGVKVLNLLEDREVLIAYSGACSSCHSATGSTLSAIQSILRAKVHPSLVVTPDVSFLTQNF